MTLRRGLASTGLLLLLASLLVGQFMATTHEFTARHATCPKHGEVIDLDSRASSLGAANKNTSTQLSTPSQEDSPTQHQHCLFVSSRGGHKSFRVVGPAESSLSTAAQWTSTSFTNAKHPSLAVYLTAPKHSPPAA